MNRSEKSSASPLHPYIGKDINWLLDAQVDMRGEKEFLVWEPLEGKSQRFSYAEFRSRSMKLAAGLLHQGLKRGDYLVIHMQNCPEFLLTWFACARLGIVVVTTNVRHTGEELAWAVDHSGARGIVTQPDLWQSWPEGHPEPEFVIVDAETGGNSHTLCWSDVLESGTETVPDSPHDPMYPLCIMYTSGTTSRPKGVVWTHGNGLWCGHTTSAHFQLTDSDIGMTVFPLFHTNAMGYSVMGSLWSGGTIVLQPRFSASRYWDVVTRNNCTWSSVNGFVVGALENLPVPEHSLRIWPVGISDFAPLEEKFKVKLVGMWGMTETVGHGIVSFPQIRGRPMCMGMVASEYEIAVRDDTGVDLAPTDEGVTGHLLIRGRPGVSLFLQYFRDHAATAASFDENSWFKTGDLVTLFSDGSIAFSDRDKDMLKVGSENVAASEVERVIAVVPGVGEVAVVGRPDKMLDEVPVAFVRATDDTTELKAKIIEACERSLADFKQPRDVLFLDEFPRATLDKVSKKDLRAMLLEDAQ